MSSTYPPTNIPTTIDQATFDSFKSFTNNLMQKQLLARIIVDESHLVLTHASFRPVMQLLQWLGSYPIQIVLITATLPPSLEHPLLLSFGITSSITLRTTTARPNISFNIIRAVGNLEDTVVHQFQKALGYSAANKVLLFCLTTREAESYAKRLSVDFCHSRIGANNIGDVLTRFRGSARGLVATSILGVGLDVPNVTHVIHAKFPRDAVSFIQEAGRAGRSGDSPAWSIVVLPAAAPLQMHPDPDHFGQRLITQALQDDAQCRRIAIQTFLDGSAANCAMLGETAHMCDVCFKMSSKGIKAQSGKFKHTVKSHYQCSLPSDASPSPNLLLASSHSQRVFSVAEVQPTQEALQLQLARHILDHYSTTCIACGLSRLLDFEDHLYRDC
ncbi:hypothetical protein D9756_011153 [Leucocoprinus leucothites]|uniref:DNA 3'-5' helicase n=1 Tax=Leucocoprinus leucothites TaxID=201217 RepID=A0A8H5CNM4_9AGAR|nr:hypothetical protein D9756_011153 [Leucoagaricus leucothites]